LQKEEIFLSFSFCMVGFKGVRSVERAKILLASYEGKNDSQIARELSTKEDISAKELNTNRQRVITLRLQEN